PSFLTNLPPTSSPHTPSLHDALPIYRSGQRRRCDESRPVTSSRVQSARGPTAHALRARRMSPEDVARRATDRLRRGRGRHRQDRSEEHTSELQSRFDLVCRLLLEKKK